MNKKLVITNCLNCPYCRTEGTIWLFCRHPKGKQDDGTWKGNHVKILSPLRIPSNCPMEDKEEYIEDWRFCRKKYEESIRRI